MKISATALALALGAVALTGCTDDGAPGARPAAQTSTPTSATSSTPAVAALEVDGLPQGPKPRIPYAFDPHPTFLDGHFRVIQPDGSRLRLPRGPMGAWTTSGDTVLRMFGTEGGSHLQLIDASGGITHEETELPGFGLVTTPDHSIVGWIGADRGFHVLERGLTIPRELPAVRAPAEYAGALLGSRTCQEQEPEGGGCTGFVNTDKVRGAQLTTSHGIVDDVPGLGRVVDGDARGRVIGVVRATGPHRGCWGLVRPGGRRAWSTCDHELLAFSPDGAHVLGIRGNSYWDTTRGVTLFDDAGEVVQEWTWKLRGPRRIDDLVWEDDDHVLAVVEEGDTWSIVRLGLDGSAELAVAPITVNEFAPFRLPLD